jgi:DNA-binding MarR family transcriptional regulator
MSNAVNLALVVGRVWVGVVMAAHGLNHVRAAIGSGDGELAQLPRSVQRSPPGTAIDLERGRRCTGSATTLRYDVLLELNAAPDRCLRMQDLAERVVLSRSRVSRLVDDLERERLVARQPDPDDGRAIRACLTAAGRRALRRAAPTYLRGIERHFTSQLTDAELRSIAGGLQKVVDRHHTRMAREQTHTNQS